MCWVIEKNQSFTSSEGVNEMYKTMFHDSQIAKTFTCGRDKCAYIYLSTFGIAPYFQDVLVKSVKGLNYINILLILWTKKFKEKQNWGIKTVVSDMLKLH